MLFYVIVVLMVFIGLALGKIGCEKDDVQIACGGFLLVAFAFIAVLVSKI